MTAPIPPYCGIHHRYQWCSHNGGFNGHQADEPPEWDKCGQCNQPLYRGLHPVGSLCSQQLLSELLR